MTRLYPNANFLKDTTLVYNEKTFLELSIASIFSMGMYRMDNMAMVSSIISLVIMTLTSIIYFNIKNRKNIYICKLFGYSNNKISIEYSLKTILELLKFSVIAIVMILVGSFFSLTSIIELKYLLIITLLVSLIAILICFLVSYISIHVIYIYNNIQTLKGENQIKFIYAFSFILKFVMILFLVINFLNLVPLIKDNRVMQENLTTWLDTENYYKTNISYIGQMDSVNIDFEANSKSKKIVNDLEQEKNGFEIYSDNYVVTSTGQYLYERNVQNGIPVDASPYGTAITVGKNYFNFNAIETENKVPIEEQIIHDENILNILVPVSRRQYQDIIIEQFKEYFYFQKIMVDNIYRKDLDEELNAMSVDELNINIIYVDDNQEYFTFNRNVAENNGNKIIDPITIININNFYYYSSMLSAHFYFYSETKNPYNDILPILVRMMQNI